MFAPPNFQQPLMTQIPRLYTTQNEYCAVAEPFVARIDETFNYLFENMQQNEEVYRTNYGNIPPYYEFGIGLQSLDSYCRLIYNENTLEAVSNRNYESTVPNPNACNSLYTNYINLVNQLINYKTSEFKIEVKEQNIIGFINQIRQIRDLGVKYIGSNITFSDQQRCVINLTRRTDAVGNLQTEVTNCVCPGLEVIEPPKDSNSQVPVTDAPVSDSSVTVPVTDPQMTASITDAPGRQP